MSLPLAIQGLLRLRSRLEQEVTEARATREHVRRMDAAAVLDRAQARACFHEEMRMIEREVMEALSAAAGRVGVEPLKLELLERFEPDACTQVRALIAENRSLVAALAEVEELNRTLLERAHRLLRGYLTTVNQSRAPTAYNRRGYLVGARAATVGVSTRI